MSPEVKELLDAARVALDEMSRINAPHNSFTDAGDRLSAAISAMSKLASWAPIETAPKDGTHVIGFTPPAGMGEMRYRPLSLGKLMPGWYLANQDPMPDWDLRMSPTHWMPLPDPPQ